MKWGGISDTRAPNKHLQVIVTVGIGCKQEKTLGAHLMIIER